MALGCNFASPEGWPFIPPGNSASEGEAEASVASDSDAVECTGPCGPAQSVGKIGPWKANRGAGAAVLHLAPYHRCIPHRLGGNTRKVSVSGVAHRGQESRPLEGVGECVAHYQEGGEGPQERALRRL